MITPDHRIEFKCENDEELSSSLDWILDPVKFYKVGDVIEVKNIFNDSVVKVEVINVAERIVINVLAEQVTLITIKKL